MVDRLLERAIWLLRIIGRMLSRVGCEKVELFTNIYRMVLRVLLPRGRKEITINGSRIAVRLNREGSYCDIGLNLVLDNKYEPLTTEYFKRLIKPKMRVVDVGANIGYFTLLAAKLVGSEGKVWAFEPEVENFDDLSKNVMLNNYGNVVLFQKAVSDRDGKASMYLSKDSGGHSLIKNSHMGYRKSIEVDTVRLDSVIKEGVDIIKSDTEGYNVAVLRGADRLLKCSNDVKLFIEYQSELFGGNSIEDLADLFSDYGFKYLYIIDDWKMTTRETTLQELKSGGREYKHIPNILCSRSEIRGVIC